MKTDLLYIFAIFYIFQTAVMAHSLYYIYGGGLGGWCLSACKL